MDQDLIDPKEKLLLEYLIANKRSMARCVSITKESYFEPPLDRVAKFIVSYYTEYHGCPSTTLINAETGVKLDKYELEDHEEAYFLQEYEAHCRKAAMINAINESVELINNDKEEMIQDLVREALMIRIDNSIGSSLFDDPQKRIEGMVECVDERPIGIPSIDNMIGNVRRGELGIVYAVSAGGKSVTLANIAYHMANQDLDVAIISLELNESLYSKRLDCITTEAPIKNHFDQAETIASKLGQMQPTMGDITVKKMRAKSTPMDIRAYLIEYHLVKGKYPDVLIIDYLALMGTNNKYHNKFDEHEEITVAVRDMMDEFQMYGFGANQINREGQDLIKVGPQHVSGGLSAIMASDWAIALTASEEDIENNQFVVSQLKIRNAEKTAGSKVLYRDPRTLRIHETGTSKPLTTPIKSKSKDSSKIDDSKGKKKLANALKID